MSVPFVGNEVLVMMPEGRHLITIKALLVDEGFVVTHTADPERALELITEKFYVCAIFDLDTPKRHKGVKWMKKARQASPQTHCFILSLEKCSAAAAISAYRGGARDVFIFNPEDLEGMAARINAAAMEVVRRTEHDRLMLQVKGTHEQFFRRMLQMYLELLEAREPDVSELFDNELPQCRILIVDSEPHLASSLPLSPDDGWVVDTVPLGSLALEQADNYHVVLVARSLPDLPGSMVATTVRKEEKSAEKHEIFVFTYDPAAPARVTLFEVSGNLGTAASDADAPVPSAFTEKDARPVDVLGKPMNLPFPAMLVERLRQFRREAARRDRKKHWLSSFKAANYDFIEEYERQKKAIAAWLAGNG